jgi:hypothetical protein
VLAEKFDVDEYRRQAPVRAAVGVLLAALVLGAAWKLLPMPAA